MKNLDNYLCYGVVYEINVRLNNHAYKMAELSEKFYSRLKKIWVADLVLEKD